jgi:hypothetical protein
MSHANADTNGYTYSDSDSNTYSHSNSYTNTDANCDGYRYSQGYAAASPYAAFSSKSTVIAAYGQFKSAVPFKAEDGPEGRGYSS